MLFGAGVVLLVIVMILVIFMAVSMLRRMKEQSRVHHLEMDLFERQILLAKAMQEKNAANTSSWNGVRKFIVARKVNECDSVCSFHLKAQDQKPLPSFEPGQFLTFELNIPNQPRRVVRCYSLSDAFSSEAYRVTVKKIPPPPDKPGAPPGLVSSFFHETVKEGDILDVRAPAGQFTLDEKKPDPVVLIAGGVGITPIFSMLKAICAEKAGREAWLFYGVTHGGEHAFKSQIQELLRATPGVRGLACYSKPRASDVLNVDYQYAGRVCLDLLKTTLPSNNYDFFVCGPAPMMESMAKSIKAWGVPENRLHTEAFGPASLKKTAPASVSTTATSFDVAFTKSNKVLKWSAESSSLLDLAEASGIAISSGCRAGNCGTCKVAVKAGKVGYLKRPGFAVEPGTCLTCIGVPESPLQLDA